MPNKWDADIAAMKLSDVEKNGLQVFRNYTQAFEDQRAQAFLNEAEKEKWDFEDVDRIHKIIVEEDARIVVVVVCAFMDDQIKEMYRRELPDGIPGGKSNLLGAVGPLSRFAQRLQIAYAFGWVSENIIDDAYSLRALRNAISHKWDLDVLRSKLDEFIDNSMTPVEEAFEDKKDPALPKDFAKKLGKIDLFRVRLIWITARFYYECRMYPKAVKARLQPMMVLYDKSVGRSILHGIAKACVGATKRVVAGQT